MYIGNTHYDAKQITKIWLDEHPTIPDDWQQEVEAWFQQWLEENHAEVEYKGLRFSAEALRDDIKNEIEKASKSEIEKEYEKVCKNKTKGWLKKYRATPEYAVALTAKLAEDEKYQQLRREDYVGTVIFREEEKKNEEKEKEKTLSRVISAIHTYIVNRLVEEGTQFLNALDLRAMIDNLDLDNTVIRKIEKWLCADNIEFANRCIVYRFNWLNFDENLACEVLAKETNHFIVQHIPKFMNKHKSLEEYTAAQLKGRNQQLARYIQATPALNKVLIRRLQEQGCATENLVGKLKGVFTKEKVIACLLQNPNYKEILAEILRQNEEKIRIEKCILERIPDRYEDLYPAARMIKRHFVLHLGPTNSGKTYSSMEAFRNAKTGVYLAPLRLLAYEAYEESNRRGCACDMVTGEEELSVPGSTHIACTIEMANLRKKYDVCVIDEAQMLSDRERGGAWTAAILGVQADVIHVCAAPNAKDILIKLIELCGDSYTVVEHQRSVPLYADPERFRFPGGIRKHDALIVFSKRSVLQVAAELQKRNLSVSVIYGALPYESRRREVERFANGETDVVVATDAIGMGMNLPVKRIVFLETEKFDGKEKRPLNDEEIKQIAGRAGRRGIYDAGYYNAEYDKKEIQGKLEQESKALKTVFLDFPDTLLFVEGKLSDLLTQWSRIQDEGIFQKQNLEVEIQLAKELEAWSDDKQLIYDFVTIPFDEKSADIKPMWARLFRIESDGSRPESYMAMFLGNSGYIDKIGLDQLELEYKKCDLLYNYLRKFHIENEREAIMSYKRQIANRISDILAKQKLPGRKCRECGRPLPWNYKT